MDSGRISGRYAKAVYTFALKKGEETRLYEEMKTLVGSFSTFHTLTRVLDDPTVSGEDKIKILTTAAGISVSDAYKGLLQLLVENKRESYALSVALMYQEYYRKQQGIVVAHLITPEPASEEMKEKLKSIIAGGTHKQVDFITHTDPNVIGGFILRLDDLQLDASVKTQLYRLKNQMIKSEANIQKLA